MRSRMLREPDGFTLTELFVAIAIVGVLAAVAVPNILGQMPRYRLNGAASQLKAELMAARMKAVSKNRKVAIFFTTAREYRICDDANGDHTVANGEGDAKVKNIQAHYPGVTLTATATPVFTPRGTLDSSGGITNITLTVSNSAGAKQLSINQPGRVQIQ
jgi:type II secretion system protein H